MHAGLALLAIIFATILLRNHHNTAAGDIAILLPDMQAQLPICMYVVYIYVER